MNIDAALEAVKAMAPTGKALIWVATAVGGAFLAGIGATLEFSTTADNVERIPAIEADLEETSARVGVLERRISDVDGELQRIRCLARLSATGQVVDPLEIDHICP